jgi:hypothetical protein
MVILQVDSLPFLQHHRVGSQSKSLHLTEFAQTIGHFGREELFQEIIGCKPSQQSENEEKNEDVNQNHTRSKCGKN